MKMDAIETKTVVEYLFEHGLYHCPLCGKKESLVEHHISYIPKATIHVCTSCHMKIHNKRRFYDNLKPHIKRTDIRVRYSKIKDGNKYEWVEKEIKHLKNELDFLEARKKELVVSGMDKIEETRMVMHVNGVVTLESRMVLRKGTLCYPDR